jgi:hypothetical protein
MNGKEHQAPSSCSVRRSIPCPQHPPHLSPQPPRQKKSKVDEIAAEAAQLRGLLADKLLQVLVNLEGARLLFGLGSVWAGLGWSVWFGDGNTVAGRVSKYYLTHTT